MKISDYIKHSLDACDERDLDRAMHFACVAIDGTAKKLYPDIMQVGERYRKFIVDHLDIIELMFGGFDLHQTIFPFQSNKGRIGLKFEDIVYEKFRCSTAHGDELPEGYGIASKISSDIHECIIDVATKSIILPETVIYALGLPCVLSPVNANQRIGKNSYHYLDGINHYVVDRWWGKIDCARSIMDFSNQIKVKIDFANVWPKT